MKEQAMIGAIGEALVDMIGRPDGLYQPHLGGSVCNFSLALARQGAPVAYLNPLSTDEFGRRFAAVLGASGVLLPASASPRPTALAMVALSANGSPSYMFYREGVADRDVSAAELIARLPPAMTLLHTGGLALVDDADKMFEVMRAATGRGAMLSVDANLRPVAARDHARYCDDVRQAMRSAHVVKVSDEDLEVLGLGHLELPELGRCLFHDSVTELVAVTLGAKGAALMTRSCMVEQKVPANLDVVDTVGAGDCFHAGLVAYMQRHRMMETPAIRALDQAELGLGLRHAIACASINIMRSGCSPPTWVEAAEYARLHG